MQLEYILPKVRHLTSCFYGIPFLALGNLAGNAIAIGVVIMRAAGRKDDRVTILGIAIAIVSASVLIHVFSRRGGILVNNVFGIVKILILLTMIGLGFWYKPVASSSARPEEAALHLPWSFYVGGDDITHRRYVTDYIKAFGYVFYSYSGFQQPFYVISEAYRPKQTFPLATISAWFVGAALFMLVNVAYLCVVPKEVVFSAFKDRKADLFEPISTLFFRRLFSKTFPVIGDAARAEKAMAALTAISIFGNILVMTFTASRVKQEIARDGIVPPGLFFARSYKTPYEWIKKRLFGETKDSNPYVEHSPIPALGLHWLTSVILILATAKLPPKKAYIVLVDLYGYVIRIWVPLVVAVGLLYLKAHPRKRWASFTQFPTVTSPFHIILYAVTLFFLVTGLFVKPPPGSAADRASEIQWNIVPSIGLSALVWGPIWFLGIKIYEKFGTRLEVNKTYLIVEQDDGSYVQKLVVTDKRWTTYNHGEAQPQGVDLDTVILVSNETENLML